MKNEFFDGAKMPDEPTPDERVLNEPGWDIWEDSYDAATERFPWLFQGPSTGGAL
jgi:hypothetical protein